MIHILAVDDDKNTRRLYRAVLERAGYTVSLAADGAEALEIFSREHIDLIILDIMMPGIDGYELTQMLRGIDENIPILMVSAKQLPEDKRLGFIVGTDDYMTKPVDDVELLLRIRALLRRARIADEKRIVIGEVILDSESMTVSRAGEVVELPLKEFQLLYKLLSYPGRIFTRIQLMNEIWGARSYGGHGIGLAIVRRIAELHTGAVRCESEGGVTRFILVLPKSR